MKSIKLTFALLVLAMVTTLISCKNTKEVEYTEPIDIEVSLYEGKYINAQTENYKAGDSLNMSLKRNSYGYGAEYKLYIGREIDMNAEETLRPSQVWIYFADGSIDYFDDKVFISDKGFSALILKIEPAIYVGKRIKEIRVQEMYKGEDRNWVLEINAEHSIGKVLKDMLEAVNEFKETQEKYK